MAQMAAQDYFSRLQMSGMHPADIANFSSLGALNSMHSNSPMASNTGGNKHSLKRKDKGSNQDDLNKASSLKDVRIY